MDNDQTGEKVGSELQDNYETRHKSPFTLLSQRSQKNLMSEPLTSESDNKRRLDFAKVDMSKVPKELLSTSKEFLKNLPAWSSIGYGLGEEGTPEVEENSQKEELGAESVEKEINKNITELFNSLNLDGNIDLIGFITGVRVLGIDEEDVSELFADFDEAGDDIVSLDKLLQDLHSGKSPRIRKFKRAIAKNLNFELPPEELSEKKDDDTFEESQKQTSDDAGERDYMQKLQEKLEALKGQLAEKEKEISRLSRDNEKLSKSPKLENRGSEQKRKMLEEQKASLERDLAQSKHQYTDDLLSKTKEIDSLNERLKKSREIEEGLKKHIEQEKQRIENSDERKDMNNMEGAISFIKARIKQTESEYSEKLEQANVRALKYKTKYETLKEEIHQREALKAKKSGSGEGNKRRESKSDQAQNSRRGSKLKKGSSGRSIAVAGGPRRSSSRRVLEETVPATLDEAANNPSIFDSKNSDESDETAPLKSPTSVKLGTIGIQSDSDDEKTSPSSLRRTMSSPERSHTSPEADDEEAPPIFTRSKTTKKSLRSRMLSKDKRRTTDDGRRSRLNSRSKKAPPTGSSKSLRRSRLPKSGKSKETKPADEFKKWQKTTAGKTLGEKECSTYWKFLIKDGTSHMIQFIHKQSSKEKLGRGKSQRIILVDGAEHYNKASNALNFHFEIFEQNVVLTMEKGADYRNPWHYKMKINDKSFETLRENYLHSWR